MKMVPIGRRILRVEMGIVVIRPRVAVLVVIRRVELDVGPRAGVRPRMLLRRRRRQRIALSLSRQREDGRGGGQGLVAAGGIDEAVEGGADGAEREGVGVVGVGEGVAVADRVG